MDFKENNKKMKIKKIFNKTVETKNKQKLQLKSNNFHISEIITFDLDLKLLNDFRKIILYNKIIGILGIINGIISTLSIIGLIGGIYTIIISIKLLNASKDLKIFCINKNGKDLKKFFDSYGKACKYSMILLILNAIFFIIYIAGIIYFCLWLYTKVTGSNDYSIFFK
jgi:envelope glycoprotein